MASELNFKAVPLPIETGGIKIALLNSKKAEELDLKHMDRIVVKKGSKRIICSVDITASTVGPGELGLFLESWKSLGVSRKGEKISIELIGKPKSLEAIKAKIDGKELNEEEVYTIIKDIVDDALTDVELTSYIVSSYTRGMSIEETYYTTKAMVKTGEMLNVGDGPVFDKHSIGGVPGNRVTMLLIPIVSSVGVKIPKTSSRAITSPAGTADTVEVFCPVNLSKRKIESIVKKINGCMVWGGSFNLAPADDKIIRVEKLLSIDAQGSMLASILAKKISAGSTHVIIDIPIGVGTKVPTHEEAKNLVEKFNILGKKLGIKVYCIVSDGSQPIGNGIGPALEARDVLKILTNDDTAPLDLKRKGILFAGKVLELAGKAPKGKGEELAKEILESGKAYEQFKRIIKAQGGDPNISLNDIKVGEYTYDVLADKKGIVTMIDNKAIAAIARAAGAPHEKGAGIFISAKLSDFVNKGDFLMRVHAESKFKLEHALEVLRSKKVFTIQ